MMEERRIRIWVTNEFRWIPASWWHELEGPKPPFNFQNDGCSVSPDYTTSGEALWPACVIHDWHYRHGPIFGLSRRQVDAIFRRNIGRILKVQGVGWWRRQWYRWTRWIGVRRFGADHYGGEDAGR